MSHIDELIHLFIILHHPHYVAHDQIWTFDSRRLKMPHVSSRGCILGSFAIEFSICAKKKTHVSSRPSWDS
jgi:hypothetical protein